MRSTTGPGGPGGGTAARPVVLVRYRPGVVGETARTVHVVLLPTDAQAGAVGALCGAVLSLSDIEAITPGQGMPCIVCLVRQTMDTAPNGEPGADGPDRADAPGPVSGATYHRWGWPVTLHHDQVQLSLRGDVSALAIPVLLSIEITQLLTARYCAPAVLAHPYAPEHHIVLTGERYGITLPWPRHVHQVTGAVLLPGELPDLVPRNRSVRGLAHRTQRFPTQRTGGRTTAASCAPARSVSQSWF